eukprot:34085-Eustigmatos_ZCMA.PRE.1
MSTDVVWRFNQVANGDEDDVDDGMVMTFLMLMLRSVLSIVGKWTTMTMVTMIISDAFHGGCCSRVLFVRSY